MSQLQINRKWGYIREFLLPSYSVYLNKQDLTEELEIEKVVKARLEPGDYQLSIKTTDRVHRAREIKYDFTISSPDDCVTINLFASKWYIFGVGSAISLFVVYWLISPVFKNRSSTQQITESKAALMIFCLQMLLLMLAVLVFVVAAVGVFYLDRFGIGIRIKDENDM